MSDKYAARAKTLWIALVDHRGARVQMRTRQPKKGGGKVTESELARRPNRPKMRESRVTRKKPCRQGGQGRKAGSKQKAEKQSK